MTTERTGECKICGKQISVKGTWFNQMFIRELFHIKVFAHWFNNHRKCDKRIFLDLILLTKSFVLIFIKIVLQIMAIALWLITYPIWALHEFLD